MAVRAFAFVILCHQDVKATLWMFIIITTTNAHMENTEYVQSLMQQSVASSTSSTWGEA